MATYANNFFLKTNNSRPDPKTVIHSIYPGIKVAPISNYEDEDFTIEIVIPRNLSIDQVEETCHKKCIKIEDEYDLFILPKVIYEE